MKSSTMAYLCWELAMAFWLAVTIAAAAGIRINHTPSLPIGIWRIEPLRGTPGPGQIVSFCPPDTPVMREARERGYIGKGRCPGGYQPMLKPVAAIGGDTVSVAAHGITVNGDLITNSARLALGTHANLCLPEGTYQVETGQVWLLSSHHPRSFDSRYFGPVPIQVMIGRAKPWVTTDIFR